MAVRVGANRCGKTYAVFTETLIAGGVPREKAIEIVESMRFGGSMTSAIIEKGIEVRVTGPEANAVLQFYLDRARDIFDHGGSGSERATALLSATEKIEWWKTAVDSLSEDDDVRF